MLGIDGFRGFRRANPLLQFVPLINNHMKLNEVAGNKPITFKELRSQLTRHFGRIALEKRKSFIRVRLDWFETPQKTKKIAKSVLDQIDLDFDSVEVDENQKQVGSFKIMNPVVTYDTTTKELRPRAPSKADSS